MHRYVSNHVSSGSNAEVIIHDNGTLDSDIILVDEAHFGVVHHPISMRATISVLTGKSQRGLYNSPMYTLGRPPRSSR